MFRRSGHRFADKNMRQMMRVDAARAQENRTLT
jgi:hypothetical protein